MLSSTESQLLHREGLLLLTCLVDVQETLIKILLRDLRNFPLIVAMEPYRFFLERGTFDLANVQCSNTMCHHVKYLKSCGHVLLCGQSIYLAAEQRSIQSTIGSPD